MWLKQVKNLIDYKLNPIVRLAGFLYIRFCCEPEYIWAWLRRYLLDDEICYPQTVSSIQMTIGEYVESLLMNLDYHNTRLPRIPNKIDNKIQAKLVLTQEKRDRKTKNLLQFNKFTKEAKVMAISRIDDEWHVGQIQSVSGKSVIVRFFDEQAHSGRPFFQGGEELVNLGEVDLIENTEALPQSTTFSQKNQSDYKNGDGEVANTKRKSKSRSKSHSRNRKKKHKRGSQSRSSSSHSSHRKDKKHRKKHSSKHHSKKDKKKSRRRSRSSSYSSSRSRSNSREKRRQKSRSIESHRKKEEIQLPRETNKEREQRYIEQLKKKQAESSVAYNRAEVARVPSSYKTALSGQFTTNVLFDRTKYDSSPRRDTQFIEISKPKVKQTVKEEAQKQQPSEKFLEQQAKIIQKYGAYSSDQAGGNRDYV